MSDEKGQGHDEAEAVTERNVTGMRELLAEKERERQLRGAEPPLDGDPVEPSQENDLANAPNAGNGTVGGIRNMGGGRP